MNSIQINCFLEAAEKRSFSVAAAALFISQPTFSRNIRMLDLFSELGISPKLLEAGSIQEQIGKVEMGEGIILINPFNSICYSPNVHCVEAKELKPQPFAIAWKKSGNSECVSLFSRFLQRYGNNRKQTP